MPQAGKVLLKRALVKLLSRSKNSSSQFSVQIQVAGARLAGAFSDFSFLFRDGNFSEIVEIKMYSLRRGPLGISGNLWKKESYLFHSISLHGGKMFQGLIKLGLILGSDIFVSDMSMVLSTKLNQGADQKIQRANLW